MFTITKIDKFGVCAKLPIKAGDRLTHINSKRVIDMLDYGFYDNISCSSLSIVRGGRQIDFKLAKSETQQLGLEFDTESYLTPVTCNNKCTFCFVHQLPKGLRKSLYVMDDDWRLSFVSGNFVTFTNMRDDEFERIIQCRFSPLYVSVHSTQPELRSRLLGNPGALPIMPILQRLTANGIKLHTQIVLCPGINDGDALKKTISDLMSLGDGLVSLAIVPVGLTEHRLGLTKLDEVNSRLAAEILRIVEDADERQYSISGRHRIFCSDEFYIKAGKPFPDAEFYEGMEQVENGVGLAAKFIEEFSFALKDAGKCRTDEFVIVSGVSGKIVIEQIINLAKRHDEKLNIRVQSIVNEVFGKSVTVTGLVTSKDIIKQLTCKGTEHVLVPSSMLREISDVFLDDCTTGQLREKLGCKLTVVDVDGYALCSALFEENI